MNYSLKTHQGKRKDNQDYTGVFFNQSGLLLAVLCDGLGGHQAGDIASEMAVSQIGNAWSETDFSLGDTYLVQKWLNEKINRENMRIYDAANAYKDLEGMGTTLVACVVFRDQILFSNIGDSRAYTYQDGQMHLITEDHSFVSELQRRGEITDAEAMHHYNKNALTRSLGVKGAIEVDFFKILKKPVDFVLLNSDGLSNVVEQEEMIQILQQEELALDEKADLLIETALKNDATDNITVNLIEVNSVAQQEVGERQ